jgi:hypothetical protein
MTSRGEKALRLSVNRRQVIKEIELERTGEPNMKAILRAVALSVTLLASAAALAGEAVPVNATFAIQWTPENWNPYGEDNPVVRETSGFGAAGLPNRKVIAIQSYDFLDTQAGTINGEAALFFNYEDGVVRRAEDSLQDCVRASGRNL